MTRNTTQDADSTDSDLEVNVTDDKLVATHHDAEIYGMHSKLDIANINRLHKVEDVTVNDQGDETTIEDSERIRHRTYKITLGNGNEYHVDKYSGDTQIRPLDMTQSHVEHDVTRTIEYDLEDIDMNLSDDMTDIKGIGSKSEVASISVKQFLVEYAENKKYRQVGPHKFNLIGNAIFGGSCYSNVETEREDDITLVVD